MQQNSPQDEFKSLIGFMNATMTNTAAAAEKEVRFNKRNNLM